MTDAELMILSNSICFVNAWNYVNDRFECGFVRKTRSQSWRIVLTELNCAYSLVAKWQTIGAYRYFKLVDASFLQPFAIRTISEGTRWLHKQELWKGRYFSDNLFNVRRWGPLASDLIKPMLFENMLWIKLRSKCTDYKPTTNDKVIRFCVTP